MAGRFLALMLVLGGLFAWQHQDSLRLAWRQAQPGYQPPAVALLATQWCGYCAKMREFLAAQGIAYTEYDVETTVEGRALMARVQGGGVPVLLVGEDVVHGYDPQGVLAAVARQ